MSPKSRKKQILIETVRDTHDKTGVEMPEGSRFYLTEKTKTLYKGVWSGACFTMAVSVPRKDCRICSKT
jgi:hypothetical protein